jgi:hypothetical protein
VIVRLLEPRPARVSFLCACRASLSFSTFDRLGDLQRVTCFACGRLWEHALVVEDGDRGWTRTLLQGPPTRLERPVPGKAERKIASSRATRTA